VSTTSGVIAGHYRSYFVAPEDQSRDSGLREMYGTSCSTCHLDFPKLNDFGKAFRHDSGIPPIGLRYNQYFQYTGTSSSKFSPLAPAGTVPPFIPTTDFQTGFFSMDSPSCSWLSLGSFSFPDQ
jgi:hypothetical protein